MLATLKQQADKLGTRLCVITFEPQPREYFQGGEAPARLSGLREKLLLLEEAGVDQVLCLPFGAKFQSLTANQFVMNVLVKGLAVRYLVVGDDFRYGCNREGDFDLLKSLGEQHGFEVCNTRTVTQGSERISSTRIRALLATGDMQASRDLLGQPYTLVGKVVKGQQLGRQLGFPTANIKVGQRRLPLEGVFAVRAWLGKNSHNAVANLGTRPTVDAAKPLLEVHLLDYNGDLYQQSLRVEFIEKIRNVNKFDSLEALKKAIAEDIVTARKIFQAE